MTSKDMRKEFNKNILAAINDGAYNAIMFFTSFYKDQIDELVRANKMGISGENMYKLANPEFNRSQMREIIKIMTHKNTSEKIINVACNPNLNVSKLNLIVLGLDHGFSYEKIMMYIGKPYSYMQMKEIYSGLALQIPVSDIRKYCNLNLQPEEMHKIKLELFSK